MFERLRDALVRLDEFERGLRSDAANRAGIVAPAQDAQVDKLIHVHLETGQNGGQVDLDDGLLARRRARQVAQQARSAERQRVHILRRNAVHEVALHKLSALKRKKEQSRWAKRESKQ